ncbi:hypothetical protein HanPSC8_Chr14g0639831 [Helianthus annuus]|nr:hypothetical protein HanPSC8_Chr14g0639831 [Helianthus annuus]
MEETLLARNRQCEQPCHCPVKCCLVSDHSELWVSHSLGGGSEWHEPHLLRLLLFREGLIFVELLRSQFLVLNLDVATFRDSHLACTRK